MQTIRSRSFAAIGAVLATFVSVTGVSPAHAADFGDQPTRHAVVSLAGIDLATPQGMTTLDRRIRAAAVRVCGPIDRNSHYLAQACRSDAVTRAMSSLPTPSQQQQLAAR